MLTPIFIGSVRKNYLLNEINIQPANSTSLLLINIIVNLLDVIMENELNADNFKQNDKMKFRTWF